MTEVRRARGAVLEQPPRRPRSVRRTSHLDVTPSHSAAARFVARSVGQARDLLTDADGQSVVVAEAAIAIEVDDDGLVADVVGTPALPELSLLVGGRLGPGFRARIEPALRASAGTPLGLLLGDLTGSPAAMRYGLFQRGVSAPARAARSASSAPGVVELPPPVCAAWRPGAAYAVAHASGEPRPLLPPPDAPSLADDPDAWHAMPALLPEQGRRARRIDVWRDGENLAVDAFFRDVNQQSSDRAVIVHEYQLSAVVDPASGELKAVAADPRVLPSIDCPYASGFIGSLVGERVQEIAVDIHSRLSGGESCTHLNDMVRFIGDAPALAAAHLPEATR